MKNFNEDPLWALGLLEQIHISEMDVIAYYAGNDKRFVSMLAHMQNIFSKQVFVLQELLERTTDNGQRTTDNGQRTTDNGQRTMLKRMSKRYKSR